MPNEPTVDSHKDTCAGDLVPQVHLAVSMLFTFSLLFPPKYGLKQWIIKTGTTLGFLFSLLPQAGGGSCVVRWGLRAEAGSQELAFCLCQSLLALLPLSKAGGAFAGAARRLCEEAGCLLKLFRLLDKADDLHAYAQVLNDLPLAFEVWWMNNHLSPGQGGRLCAVLRAMMKPGQASPALRWHESNLSPSDSNPKTCPFLHACSWKLTEQWVFSAFVACWAISPTVISRLEVKPSRALGSPLHKPSRRSTHLRQWERTESLHPKNERKVPSDKTVLSAVAKLISPLRSGEITALFSRQHLGLCIQGWISIFGWPHSH